MSISLQQVMLYRNKSHHRTQEKISGVDEALFDKAKTCVCPEMMKFLLGAALTQAQRKMQGAQLHLGELVFGDPVISELQMWYASGLFVSNFSSYDIKTLRYTSA